METLRRPVLHYGPLDGTHVTGEIRADYAVVYVDAEGEPHCYLPVQDPDGVKYVYSCLGDDDHLRPIGEA